MEPYVGQIIPVGFNFAPTGWFLCNGQLVPISEYTVLFNLIGTTYGGDGVQTFGIPDLRGRVPLDAGTGSGLSTYVMGQQTGTDGVTLTSLQLPTHSHLFLASGKAATTTTPGPGTALGPATAGTGIFVYGAAPSTTSLSPQAIAPNGGSLPHDNQQPYLAVNFIIAWAGIYPTQG